MSLWVPGAVVMLFVSNHKGFQVNNLLPEHTPGLEHQPRSLHDGSSEDADLSKGNITYSQPGSLAAETNNPHFYIRILS